MDTFRWIYIYVCVYTDIYICVRVHIYICYLLQYVCVCMWIHVNRYMCIYVSVCVYMDTYKWIYIYIYATIHVLGPGLCVYVVMCAACCRVMRGVLQCVAVCCSVSQCVARCIAVCCSVLRIVYMWWCAYACRWMYNHMCIYGYIYIDMYLYLRT